jgi:alpha-tubulin suppressor-like RCC1 family protein
MVWLRSPWLLASALGFGLAFGGNACKSSAPPAVVTHARDAGPPKKTTGPLDSGPQSPGMLDAGAAPKPAVDAQVAQDARVAPDAKPAAPPPDSGSSSDPIAALSGGAAHACATTSLGVVWGWGRNTHGELAAAPETAVLDPQVLSIKLHLKSVRAGGASKDTGHTCGIADGVVYCWGANDYGQLGDGTKNASHEPVRALGISDAIALDVGGSHSCALRADGSALCWGRGDSGQLGTGKLNDELQPAPVVGLSGATALRVGTYHGCAQRAQDVLCWGANSYGELGRGDRVLSATPVAVSGLGEVRAIEAGGFASCALRMDGHVSCWGSNEYGQLGTGNGGSGNVSMVPAAVSGIDDVAQISLGGSHSCARTQSGAAYCWGGNALGQLGDGTQSGHDKPAQVAGLDAVQQIEAASGFTLALDGKLGVVAFGANDSGQLGDGTRSAHAKPQSVRLQ